MKLNFDNLLSKYHNQSCIVIAHGPSLDYVINDIKDYHLLIGTNDWYFFHDNVPHFWVMANGIYTIKNNIKKMNEFNSTIVYADSVDYTSREWIEQNLKNDYIPYDQRHFKRKRCKELINSDMKEWGGFDPSERCCHHILPRYTIQEKLQDFTGYHKHYGTGDTVIVHQIALAILLGCNPIYITGMDLDYNLGFAKNTGNKTKNSVGIGELINYQKTILRDLEILRESAKCVGSKLINTNKKSTFDVIEIGDIEN